MNGFRWRRGTSAIGRYGWTVLSWQKHLRLLYFPRMGSDLQKPQSLALQRSRLEPPIPSRAVGLSFFIRAEWFAFCTSSGLRCIGKALHETPENLTNAGAVHVVRDFENVSLWDLDCILLRRVDPISHQAAAAGGT
jgi:hypothetical protein